MVAVSDTLVIREATEADIEAIVRLHEADEFGHGDSWTSANEPLYRAAFARIRAQEGTSLWVVDLSGEVVGTFQLMRCPVLSRRGAINFKLESVQVRGDMRSQGIGARMVAFAEDYARAHDGTDVILTSNKRRLDAHRFYERLGYMKNQEGFRKSLG